MVLEKIKLYRMTHIDNVPHILEHGITHRASENANPNFLTIGDVSLINTRCSKTVFIDNGDLMGDGDYPSIVLGQFIPFYFGIKMPMLYVIQFGGNFVQSATPPKDIVYLVCPLKNIIESGIEYYFSDGHATDSLTTFYDKSQIESLPEIVSWESVTARYWGGQENLNVKRKKQAEFLVAEDLSPNFIIGFACYNVEAKQRLIGMGIAENKIKVVPSAYY